MTPIEDPASVTIPTLTAKDSTESELIASPTPTSGSSSNAAIEIAHNQSNAADTEANDRKSYFNVSNVAKRETHLNSFISGDGDNNGLNGSATGKSSEDDVIDNKSHKYIPGQYSNNSNNTRTLTQQSSLVAPSEVHISISPALIAQPVLTPNGRFLLSV